MKQLFTTLFVMLMAISVAAAPIDKEKALQSAKTFMSQQGLKTPSQISFVYQGQPQRAKGNGTSSQHAPYYIFNNGGNNGFVIVSGDDRTPSILGYSNKGAFHTEDIPTNMAEWLEGYADQIAYLDSTGIKATWKSIRKAPTMRAISPLLTSHWTQNSPFNNLLPVIQNKHLPAGCGATAMAQVMYYHKWPYATTDTIPGYKNPTQYSGYDEIYLDTIPAGEPFDWANMLDVYTGNETETQEYAVAFLTLACGTALKMRYKVGGSSSYLSDIPGVLTQYFGYDSGVQHKARRYFSYDEWDQMLYTELSAGRPIPYSGQSTGGGHAFVIDGYDGEGLYHINWGWNNGTDGYFLISILDPGDNSGTGASTTNTGYNMTQEAIVGIQPPSSQGGTTEAPHLTFSIIGVSDTKATVRYCTDSNIGHTFLKALGYYNEDGEIQQCSQRVRTSISYGYSGTYGFNVQISTPGRYVLFPMSKEEGTDKWIPARHDVEYIECIIDDDGTMTLVLHPIKALEATFAFQEPKIKGMEEKVDITIKNIGEEYIGDVYLTATNGSEKNTSSYYIQLIAGKTSILEASFVPQNSGVYNITLSTDENGNEVVATSSVSISEGSFISSNVLTAALAIENSSGNNVYGNKLKGTYTITNPTSSIWSGDLRIWIFHNTSGSGTFNSVTYSNFTEVLQPGESKALPFNFTGVYDEYYLTQIRYAGNSNEVIHQSSVYKLAHGYVSYKADGTMSGSPVSEAITIDNDIVAVDFSGVSEDAITSIKPNSNPNTLYYFSEGSTLTSKLTTSVNNIVKGSTATNITLTDQKDFLIPITFTANSISYNRKPQSASQGNVWETIALPFEVSTIKADGTAIDFYHSATDKDKAFWLKEFVEYEGKQMLFGFPEKMEACVPYLIGFPSSLQNKTIRFEGTNATLTADSKIASGSQFYNLVGTMTTLSKEKVYTLSGDGKEFTLMRQATIAPFRAYVNAKYDEGLPSSLPIWTKIPGDANGDGNVNVIDVTTMVDYILSINKTGVSLFNVDMNKDGRYNVTDITMIVNIILGIGN